MRTLRCIVKGKTYCELLTTFENKKIPKPPTTIWRLCRAKQILCEYFISMNANELMFRINSMRFCRNRRYRCDLDVKLYVDLWWIGRFFLPIFASRCKVMFCFWFWCHLWLSKKFNITKSNQLKVNSQICTATKNELASIGLILQFELAPQSVQSLRGIASQREHTTSILFWY